MNTSDVIQPALTNHYQGQLLLNESLADYTTWRVGGRAKALYKPTSVSDLAIFLSQLPKDEPLLWLGLGSNSLIKDDGFSGTVILTQGCLNEIQVIEEGVIRVEAGVSCAKMARFCARNDLAGGEFWAGIPGTMGGALRMNAGCFNGETWQFVVLGLQDEWFVSATCRFPKGEKEQSLALIKELLAHRAATQPTNEYNCGSVFRNPPGNYAAKLIESCGLKGLSVVGAMVSEKHANFIINSEGKASARDIETLIQSVQKTVFAKTGIELMREVHLIGDGAC